MHRACRCRVRKLPDGIGDQAPGRRAAVIAFELVRAGGAFLVGSLAVALEHQGRSPPDVDVRYHRTKAYERAIWKRDTKFGTRARPRAVECRRF